MRELFSVRGDSVDEDHRGYVWKFYSDGTFRVYDYQGVASVNQMASRWIIVDNTLSYTKGEQKFRFSDHFQSAYRAALASHILSVGEEA